MRYSQMIGDELVLSPNTVSIIEGRGKVGRVAWARGFPVAE
jgi:hypothetical protein